MEKLHELLGKYMAKYNLENWWNIEEHQEEFDAEALALGVTEEELKDFWWEI